jgi:AcrR family transcriptional regulator
VKSRLRDGKAVVAHAARRSKDAVVAATLAATYELLSESGLGGVSIDEVSRRSGVAKTTIYRHWATRSALLLDACSQLSPRPTAPDRGSLRADLTELALVIAQRLHAGRWSSVIPSVIDAAERDPEIAELHSRLHAGMMSAFQTVVAQARKRGEIGAERDLAEITASIAGPLFYRRGFSINAGSCRSGPRCRCVLACPKCGVSNGRVNLRLSARANAGKITAGFLKVRAY